MKSGRLTPRHRRFVEQYLVDLNATQAAIRAGYSRRSAPAHSHELLRRPDIAAAVEKGKTERKEQARITSDRVLEAYGHIAFADMRNFAEWGPDGVTLREKSTLSAADAAAIADIQPGSNGKGAKIRLYDKKAALDTLAKHLGLFDPARRIGTKDQTAAGDEARKILRERILKLMGKRGN